MAALAESIETVEGKRVWGLYKTAGRTRETTTKSG